MIPRGASVGARQPHVPPPAPPTTSLLLHFDSSQLDEVSQEVFTSGWPTYAAGVFGNAARSNSEFPGACAGAWSEALSIGTQPFTIEFRARFEFEEDTGGILIAKNYWVTEPAAADFALDWQVSVGPGYIDLSWSELGVSGSPDSVNVVIPDSAAWRAFAITDDGTNLRFYVDGTRVYEGGSVQLSGTIPAVSGARVSLYNALQGFSGPSPDWGWAVFTGWVDELRLTLGEALYTGASYTLATQPFSL